MIIFHVFVKSDIKLLSVITLSPLLYTVIVLSPSVVTVLYFYMKSFQFRSCSDYTGHVASKSFAIKKNVNGNSLSGFAETNKVLLFF